MTNKPFETFHKQWALVTAGNESDYNTMTISWGGLGTLWSKPVATVYVKPIRHTYNYLEANDYFTVSFYDDTYKKDLGTLGRLSGRDQDKVALTSLTPVAVENSMTFKEAHTTYVCKKIYFQDLDLNQIPEDAIKNYYETEAPHRMYIGEVVEIITK